MDWISALDVDGPAAVVFDYSANNKNVNINL